MKRLLSQKHLEATSTVDTTSLMVPVKLFIDNVSPTVEKRTIN